MSTDRTIRIVTTIVVSVVAFVAALISYGHLRSVALTHGQNTPDATLIPFSVDGLICAASLVLFYASRNKLKAPLLGRIMLGLGVAATIAANSIYGSKAGILGILISATPAVSFIGAVELLIWLIRSAAQANVRTELWDDPKETERGLVRSWAAGQGIPVKKRGRIPRDVSRAYQAAMSGQNGNGSQR